MPTGQNFQQQTGQKWPQTEHSPVYIALSQWNCIHTASYTDNKPTQNPLTMQHTCSKLNVYLQAKKKDLKGHS